jgi:molybdopterin synthase sulfur carrier subunit
MANVEQNIRLHYYALLREQAGRDHEELATQARTPRALYDELKAKYNFTLPMDRVGVAVNDRFCSLDQPLQQGDSVVFIPPVAGG